MVGSRERSPPATERAGAWPSPGPQHPLFAQPAPAGESKQGKVNEEGDGAEALAAPARSPPQHELSSSSPRRAKGKAPGYALPEQHHFFRGIWGFSRWQTGWKEKWGAPREAGVGWGRWHRCAHGAGAGGEWPGGRGEAPCAFAAVGKQKAVYFAPIIPFPTNLFSY